LQEGGLRGGEPSVHQTRQRGRAEEHGESVLGGRHPDDPDDAERDPRTVGLTEACVEGSELFPRQQTHRQLVPGPEPRTSREPFYDDDLLRAVVAEHAPFDRDRGEQARRRRGAGNDPEELFGRAFGTADREIGDPGPLHRWERCHPAGEARRESQQPDVVDPGRLFEALISGGRAACPREGAEGSRPDQADQEPDRDQRTPPRAQLCPRQAEGCRHGRYLSVPGVLRQGRQRAAMRGCYRHCVASPKPAAMKLNPAMSGQIV
jgi:hypothetical protein